MRASAACVVSGTATGNSAWAIVEARSMLAIQRSKVFQGIVRSTAGDFSANGRFVIVSTPFQMSRWIVTLNGLVGSLPSRTLTNQTAICLCGIGHFYKETAALAATYNLRLGRGDRKGASQLAGFALVCGVGTGRSALRT